MATSTGGAQTNIHVQVGKAPPWRNASTVNRYEPQRKTSPEDDHQDPRCKRFLPIPPWQREMQAVWDWGRGIGVIHYHIGTHLRHLILTISTKDQDTNNHAKMPNSMTLTKVGQHVWGAEKWLGDGVATFSFQSFSHGKSAWMAAFQHYRRRLPIYW
jgi:hypothetical protein